MKGGSDTETVVVVPCYNEARRLDPTSFKPLWSADGVRVIFVDDGSTDGTGAILHSISDTADNVDVLILSSNSGKGEAVRRGLVAGCETGAAFVGYLDADLATSPEEFLTLVDAITSDDALDAVLGARVALLGRRVERKALRHYSGRVFASLASLALSMPVYDTQCGAKVFRVTPNFEDALDEPFRSSWFFDVELLFRLKTVADETNGPSAERFLEIPLWAWRDVDGSRVSALTAVDGLVTLTTIARRRRRQSGLGHSRRG